MNKQIKNLYIIMKVLMVLITFLTVFLLVMNFIIMIVDNPYITGEEVKLFMKNVITPGAEVAKMNAFTLGIQFILLIFFFIIHFIYKKAFKEPSIETADEDEPGG